MNSVFGAGYAGIYDALYADKDYAGECGVIEKILKCYAEGPAEKILDLGCGTGRHARLLARAGYHVTGVDRSQAMLAEAQKKSSHPNAAFHLAGIEEFQLPDLFDAAVMMFAVLSYQLEDKDVLQVFRNIRKHLRPGGLFLFDFWNESAVRSQAPSERVKKIVVNGEELERLASGILDPERNICHVHYEIKRGKSEILTREAHSVRFFSGTEIGSFLTASGFGSLVSGAFPDYERPATASDWTAFQIARAV